VGGEIDNPESWLSMNMGFKVEKLCTQSAKKILHNIAENCAPSYIKFNIPALWTSSWMEEGEVWNRRDASNGWD